MRYLIRHDRTAILNRLSHTRAVDRSEMEMACRSKSIIELLRTRRGRALYYNSFIELWTQFVETELVDYPERAEIFKIYLEDIKEAVEANNNNKSNLTQ